MYHPAAFERAADSINGVETQGLGRSEVGRLPMMEDSWAFLGLLSIYLWTNCSRLLKGICKDEGRGEA